MEVKRLVVPLRKIPPEGLEASWASSRSLRLSRNRSLRLLQPSTSTMVERLKMVYHKRQSESHENVKSPLRSISCMIPNLKQFRDNKCNYRCFPQRTVKSGKYKAAEIKSNPTVERNLRHYFTNQLAFSQSAIFTNCHYLNTFTTNNIFSNTLNKPHTAIPSNVRKQMRAETAITVKTERLSKKTFNICPWEPEIDNIHLYKR